VIRRALSNPQPSVHESPVALREEVRHG